jgi:hypothetical protein
MSNFVEEIDGIKNLLNEWHQSFDGNSSIKILLNVKKDDKSITKSSIKGNQDWIPIDGLDMKYGHQTTQQENNNLISGGDTFISSCCLYFISQDPCLAHIITAINNGDNVEIKIKFMDIKTKKSLIEYTLNYVSITYIVISGIGVMIGYIPEKLEINSSNNHDSIGNNIKAITN